MTDEEHEQCHIIINNCVVDAGYGNAIPVPGTGVAVDIIAMTAMTVNLARVFGFNMPDNDAKELVITTIKQTMLDQPLKTITKELVKLPPGLGTAFSSTIRIAVIEAAGWAIAEELGKRKEGPGQAWSA